MSERPAAARSLHLTKRLAGQVWTAIIQPTEGTHEPPSSTVGRAPGPRVAVPGCDSGTAVGRPRILRDRRTSLLDPSVRAGKHNGLMTVVVTDEIRRSTVDASRLEDDSSVVTHPDSFAPEVKTVTFGGSHGSSPLAIVLLPV